jgi:hypothetical protein
MLILINKMKVEDITAKLSATHGNISVAHLMKISLNNERGETINQTTFFFYITYNKKLLYFHLAYLKS